MTAKQGPSNPIPAMATYEPLEQPVVVIGSQFLAHYPVHLTVTRRGKDFNITDVNGTLIFQVKSKSFSIHGRRFLRDAAGNTLVSYKEKLISLHNRKEVFRGECQDEEALLFRGATTSSNMYETENIDLNIHLANNSVEEAPDFKVKGSGKERSCAIYLGNGESNIIIGKMERNFAGNFTVTAYPNGDYAFIVALVVFVFLDVIKADGISKKLSFSAKAVAGAVEAAAPGTS